MRCPCGKTIEAKPGKAERLPMGWKRDPATQQPVCPKCWGQRFVLRAITIPVAGPVGIEWPELREALKGAWQRATRLANRAVQELLKNDVLRTKEMAKLPPMPKINLYQVCRDDGYDGWSQSAAAVLRAVEARYRATRYERIWRGRVSLPNTKYPLPFPIHNAAWQATWLENGERVPHVALSLPDAGRITLRLRGGREFGRQLSAFAQIAGGQAVQGELALYEVRAHAGDHRNGGSARDGAGAKYATRILCKMVAWLPRAAKRESTGTLYVRTDRDSLLIALDVKEETLWIQHADHLRRWIAEHRRRLNRWADDQKAEQRPVASFTGRRERAVLKHRYRMDSAIHEAAAQLANFAARRRVATVRYDDSQRGFVESFPWDRLKRLITEKCDAQGIEVEIVASGSVAEKGTAPLAEPQGVMES